MNRAGTGAGFLAGCHWGRPATTEGEAHQAGQQQVAGGQAEAFEQRRQQCQADGADHQLAHHPEPVTRLGVAVLAALDRQRIISEPPARALQKRRASSSG